MEPWLRGILPDLHPVTGHLLRASEQIREDVGRALHELTVEEIWVRPHGMTSAGFHAKHLAGSTGRLCTYLECRALSEAQLAAIPQEASGTESASELLTAVSRALDQYENLVRGLSADEFHSVRLVGRDKLQTTAVGLAIHIAEHGQRHAGQLISAAKLACSV